MFRNPLTYLALGCLAGSASAQATIGPEQTVPITTPIVDSGVFDWDEKRWLPDWEAHQLRASILTVYNNTCTWTGGNGFDTVSTCVTYFDEGRIPGGVGGTNPSGSSTDNLIDSFEIAYCTKAATGTVDVKLGFYENWSGCLQNLGGAPWTGPLSGVATAYIDLGQAAGFPLPGDPTPGGAFFCTRVTINLGSAAFCMQSDGEGFYDNLPRLDSFAWSFENNTQGPSSQAVVGIVRAGEPALAGPSGCTYNVPCGTDNSPWLTFSTNPFPCGSGLGTEDIWWMNVDNDTWGNTTNTSTCTLGTPAQGSGCYFFGGYPANVFASYWLKLGSAGSCAGCSNNATAYCTAGTTTNGCVPAMSLNGVASVAGLQPALLTASNVEGQKTGLIFVGLQTQALPWATGSSSFFCVKSPTVRLPPAQNSGGTAGQCNGTIAADINSFVQASNGVLLGQTVTPGFTFHAQGWFRDPPAPKATNLTNGLTVTFCP
jgi:hypothetical protein